MSTTQQVIQKLQDQLNDIDKAFGVAVAATHARMAQRIFVDGKNSLGKSIGEYNSTKRIYVQDNNSPKKLSHKGKYGKNVFKNKKPHKTTYFPSYKDFRGKVGRQTSPVNLVLSGLLQRDFASHLKKNGKGYAVTISNSHNMDKILGNEKRFAKNGKIFAASKDEMKFFKETEANERVKLMRK